MREAAVVVIVCGLLALAGATPAAAQGQESLCVMQPPSFTPTRANRLSCEDVLKLRQTHHMVAIRSVQKRPNCQSRHTRLSIDRRDGSFVQTCEVKCNATGRFQGFDWKPCGTADDRNRAGVRTTGVGTCNGGVWCGAALGLYGEAEACHAIHREGDRYAVVHVRGQPTCWDGDVTFVRR